MIEYLYDYCLLSDILLYASGVSGLCTSWTTNIVHCISVNLCMFKCGVWCTLHFCYRYGTVHVMKVTVHPSDCHIPFFMKNSWIIEYSFPIWFFPSSLIEFEVSLVLISGWSILRSYSPQIYLNEWNLQCFVFILRQAYFVISWCWFYDLCKVFELFSTYSSFNGEASLIFCCVFSENTMPVANTPSKEKEFFFQIYVVGLFKGFVSSKVKYHFRR